MTTFHSELEADLCVCGHSILADHPTKGASNVGGGGACVRCNACVSAISASLPDFGADVAMWHAWSRALFLTTCRLVHERMRLQLEIHTQWRSAVEEVETQAVTNRFFIDPKQLGVITGPAAGLATAAQEYVVSDKATDWLLRLERAAVNYCKELQDRSLTPLRDSLKAQMKAIRDEDRFLLYAELALRKDEIDDLREENDRLRRENELLRAEKEK